MENQHRKIKGYRDLSEQEINAMNRIKEKAAEIGELVNDLKADPELDQGWVLIGKTNLQQGFMALTRAVTKPDFF